MKRDIFIGAAWPYANYLMHIGHLAAFLPGDVIARYYRGHGDTVIYVSGTDCHGTPITERAKKEGIAPQEISAHYHEEFVKTFEAMNFTYDLYTRTSHESHKEMVQAYFKKLVDNGYIYEKEEEQDYCPQCDMFLSDREIVGICPHCSGEATGDQCDDCLRTIDPKELTDKHCKTCGSDTVLRTNKHLYFKLSAFQDQIQELVEENEHNWRKTAIGETKKFLSMGLLDRATTRQLTWGIEVPVDGYDDKRIYVWIEAVLGYLTAGRRVAQEKGIDFDQFMSNQNPNLSTYYVHGKDNVPFHTVIFPSLLLALRLDYQLPKYIISSEYMNMNDEKMSKSKGNLITVNDLVKDYPRDTIRYYMIANGPEKKDVNFTIADMVQTHNKFLVGVLGNFVNRNLSFLQKKFDGVIQEGTIDPEVEEYTKRLYEEVSSLIERGELKTALDHIMDYVSFGNKYYDEKQPWIQVKEDETCFHDITYTCVYMMANLKNFLAPFMPDTSEKIQRMLTLNAFQWEEETLRGNKTIQDLQLLFERIDEK